MIMIVNLHVTSYDVIAHLIDYIAESVKPDQINYNAAF